MIARRLAGAACALMATLILMGAADGRWLDRVPARDHARIDPLLRSPRLQQQSAAAGATLYRAECARCHGVDGHGLYGRPPVVGRHVASASDGDLFWLMNNGVPWKGMPPWMMLPATERWQLVTYLRSLNTAAPPTTSVPGASR